MAVAVDLINAEDFHACLGVARASSRAASMLSTIARTCAPRFTSWPARHLRGDEADRVEDVAKPWSK
jgi:hypothetical protein